MRRVFVCKFMDEDTYSPFGPSVIVLKPQTGKTRSVIRKMLKTVRHGDTVIYASSSHGELASAFRHAVDLLREYNYDIRIIIFWYCGLNKFCPNYKEIKKLRKELGARFKQTEFCRKCPYWRMKPLQKELFEPGKAAVYIRGKEKLKRSRRSDPSIVYERIRFIMTEYSLKALQKFYPHYIAPDVMHHTIVLRPSDNILEPRWGEPLYIKGCPRALLMKKLIQIIERRGDGTIKKSKKRSAFGYPLLLLIPHELLPLALRFASAYSVRLFVVIDEYDRLIFKKVPRWLAERYGGVEKVTRLPMFFVWTKNIPCHLMEDISGDEEEAVELYNLEDFLTGGTMSAPELKVKTDDTGLTVTEYLEVPLVSIVFQELYKVKEKQKLAGLTIIGSSVPLLPLKTIYYTLKEMAKLFHDDEILIYYSYLEAPEYIIMINTKELAGRKGVLYIVGSKLAAGELVSKRLWNSSTGWLYMQLPNPIAANDTEAYIYRAMKGWECRDMVCIDKSRRKMAMFKPYIKGEYCVGYYYREIKIGKDYVRLNTSSYIAWLGGRLTRGYTLPPDIKILVVDTKSGAETREGGTTIYRLIDFLQILFRITSRPDVKLVVASYAVPVIETVITLFNKHVACMLKIAEHVERLRAEGRLDEYKIIGDCTELRMKAKRRKKRAFRLF